MKMAVAGCNTEHSLDILMEGFVLPGCRLVAGLQLEALFC